MSKIAAMTFLLCHLVSILTFAQMGPSNGGGGDVVILPNDDVILADPFLDHGGPQPNNMPPLRSINPRILQAITLYTKATEPILNSFGSDISNLMKELSKRSSDLRFYAVQNTQELNNFCAPGGRKTYTLPDGAIVQNAACTAGDETFLVEPLFIRLSIRDQALLLIHERLTTLRDSHGGKNYSAIARFTTGLKIFLNVAREQGIKTYRPLSPIETNQLTEFYIAAEEIEKRNSEVSENSFMWKAHPNGGGRVHLESSVSNDAFVCLFCIIHKKSTVEAKTQILNSSIASESVIKANVQIVNSSVGTGSIIEEGAQLLNTPTPLRYKMSKDSVINNFNIPNALRDGEDIGEITLSDAARIENSTYHCKTACSFNLGARNLIKSSYLAVQTFNSQNDVKIIESKIEGGQLYAGNSLELTRSTISLGDMLINIKDNQRMTDGSLNKSSLQYAPVGYKIKTFSDSVILSPSSSSKTFIDGVDRNFKRFKEWSSEGFFMKVTFDVKIKKEKLFSKWGWAMFSNAHLSINVTDGEIAPPGLYTMRDGLLEKAGVLQWININKATSDFELGPKDQTFMNALYDLAKRNGFKVLSNQIVLPIISTNSLTLK